jgi:hypothetical protein
LSFGQIEQDFRFDFRQVLRDGDVGHVKSSFMQNLAQKNAGVKPTFVAIMLIQFSSFENSTRI